MKIFSRLFYISLLIIILTPAVRAGQRPRNLIIFIGDGMGVAHVYAAMTVSGNEMTFPAFPVTGFSITHSKNSYSTDSAAGGTAIATGEKTDNRMISTRPDSTAIKSLFEFAKEKGLSTGIVCTSALTDATPAAFVSHVPLRYDYFSIADQYASGAADLFIGGGSRYFQPAIDTSAHPSRNYDAAAKLKEAGYDVVHDLASFMGSGSGQIAGLMSPEDMPRIFEGRDPQYLASATRKAIEVLSANRKGFILLVEGSEIDDAGHSNDTKMVTDEVLDMDRAVAVAYDFARSDGHTLIVVTADHETGGMSITGGDLAKKEVTGSFSIRGHSGVMVPVFAFGPGAEAFSGVQDNTDLFRDFYRLLSLGKKE